MYHDFMWFLLALTSYVILAVIFILDKFIVSQSKVKPVVYTFYSTIFMFGAIFLLPFVGFGMLGGIDWLLALISGLGFGLGLWTFYKAVEKGETTHISPFNGAMVTVFIYLLSFYFLGDKLTMLQQVGVFVLIFASLMLSFEKSRQHKGFHIGFIWAIISGLFFAISHVSAKYLYGNYDFWTAFVWTRATTGLVGLLALCSPVVWQSFKKKKVKSKSYAKRNAVPIVVANKVLSVVAIIVLQYAFSIGSATLVGAMSGLQFVLMFIFVYLLTKIIPKVFKEYFTKDEIITQMIALLLVVLGSALLVV